MDNYKRIIIKKVEDLEVESEDSEVESEDSEVESEHSQVESEDSEEEKSKGSKIGKPEDSEEEKSENLKVKSDDSKKKSKDSKKENSENSDDSEVGKSEKFIKGLYLQSSFGLRPPVTTFVGRSEELKKLKHIYYESSHTLVILRGDSGVGKSELARKFMHELSTEKSPPLLAWLLGQNAFSLQESLRSWYYYLTRDQTWRLELLVSVLIKLSKAAVRTVIVIDNVDVVYDEYKKLQSMLMGYNVLVVITTNSQKNFRTDSKRIRVNIFNKLEANLFLKINSADNFLLKSFKRLYLLSNKVPRMESTSQQSNTEEHCIFNLNRNYVKSSPSLEGFLPLQLDLCLRTFNSTDNKLIEQDMSAVFSYSSVRTILEMAMKNITRLSTIKLLHILAFLYADDIELNFISKIFSHYYESYALPLYDKEISKDIQKSLEILKDLNLISQFESKVSIHRLTQYTLRSILKDTDTSEYKNLIDSLNCYRTKFNFAECVNGNDILQLHTFWEHIDEHRRHETSETMKNLKNDAFHRLPLFGTQRMDVDEGSEKLDLVEVPPKTNWNFSEIDPEKMKTVEGIEIRTMSFNKIVADDIVANLKVLHKLCSDFLSYVLIEVGERNEEAYDACQRSVNEMGLSLTYTAKPQLTQSREIMVSLFTTEEVFLEVNVNNDVDIQLQKMYSVPT